MNREIKAFIILENEITELKVIFYTEIVLDLVSIFLMILCFYIWAYLPQLWWWSLLFSVLSFICGGVGVYLSILQSRIWRRIRMDTHETIVIQQP